MHVSQTIQLPTGIAFPCTPFDKEEKFKDRQFRDTREYGSPFSFTLVILNYLYGILNLLSFTVVYSYYYFSSL